MDKWVGVDLRNYSSAEQSRITKLLKDEGLSVLDITSTEDGKTQGLRDGRFSHNKGKPCPTCGQTYNFSTELVTDC